jgi:hypothetical protein
MTRSCGDPGGVNGQPLAMNRIPLPSGLGRPALG